MQTISFSDFIARPGTILTHAAQGQHVKVATGRGNAANIIDESEWTMLNEALKLCTEHLEWTTKAK